MHEVTTNRDRHTAADATRSPLVSEEIQNVTKGTCVGFVDFCVLAPRASNGSKLFVLNIEELGRPSAGCSKLTSFKLLVSAFRALPVIVLHVFP
jgi:hypothetical protein